MKKVIGKIFKNPMILREYKGEASNGRWKYELAISFVGNPIVTSKKTGKAFVLKWEDIIKIAVEQGIDFY